ncbi:MAG: hypothetical protein U0797_14575, partial [Gemmataceae bacterium]
MGSKRLRAALAVLLGAGVSSAARAQLLAPPPAVPEAAAALLPAPATGKAPGGQDDSSSPGQKAIELKPPPLEVGDVRYPINLATALRLADARPLVIAAAQASAWKAEAQLQQAKVLWVPTLNLGFDYIRHDGFGPDLNRGVNIPWGVNALGQADPTSFGKPLNQNFNFFYSGAGLTYSPNTPNYLQNARLGDPLLPSPQMQFLTDIIYQPLYARQRLNSERWDIQRGKNDALRDTGRAYFEVHRHRGKYAGALFCVEEGRQLVQTISTLSKDLVPTVEVDRARNILADLEQQAASSRQYWRRASADLTRVLRLDPRAVVEPLEDDHLQITLFDPGRSLDDLIPIGLTNRPELAQHQAMVQATLVAIRREKLRPLLPSVLLNGFQTPYELIQGGIYGEGRGSKLNLWSGRNDVSIQVLWQANNLGLGNLATIKQQRADSSQALVRLFAVQDGVAGDVTRAQADLQAAAVRVGQAERELRSAIINYQGNVEGLKETSRFGNILIQVFRPQEVTAALQLLKRGYDHYFDTVADYNVAQFELFHALGYPAQELSTCRVPGEVLPVD